MFVRLAIPILLTLTFVDCAGCALSRNAMRLKIVAHSEGTSRAVDPSEHTTIVYAMGDRTRIESPAMGYAEPMVSIQQCDKHVMYVLSPKTREYMELPMPPPSAKDKQNKWSEHEANLMIETVSVDTGETKKPFGHTARHYVTTTTVTPSGELEQQPNETVIDAWYLDMRDVTRCDQGPVRFTGVMSAAVGVGVRNADAWRNIRPYFRYSGAAPTGLVLSQKRTSRSAHVLTTGEKQDNLLTNYTEIVEMEDIHMDTALFDVPSGYKKVEKFTK